MTERSITDEEKEVFLILKGWHHYTYNSKVFWMENWFGVAWTLTQAYDRATVPD